MILDPEAIGNGVWVLVDLRRERGDAPGQQSGVQVRRVVHPSTVRNSANYVSELSTASMPSL